MSPLPSGSLKANFEIVIKIDMAVVAVVISGDSKGSFKGRC
jgi:hypothetical protein